MPSQADYLAISQAMYVRFGDTPISPLGWSLIASPKIVENSGMMAATFRNNTSGEIVVGIQGTNATSGNEAWFNAQMNSNTQIAAFQRPASYPDASEYVAFIKELR